MLKALLCGWLLLPCVVLGSTWTGSVTVGSATAKLVIQMDREGCYLFIAEPVSVNAKCTITEATGTKLAFYTRTPETDWLGEISGSTMTGYFFSERRRPDDAGTPGKGVFTVKLEGSEVPTRDRTPAPGATSSADVAPPPPLLSEWLALPRVWKATGNASTTASGPSLAPTTAAPGVQPQHVDPRVRFKIDPDYTQAGRKGKIEGLVVLSCTVTTEGICTDIRVVRSLDDGLDQNAVEALKRWTFWPATNAGKPVEQYAVADFSFKLDGSLDRAPNAVTPPAVRPPSDDVVAWRNGGKRFYQQGAEFEQLDADGVTVAVNLQPSGSWLVATVLVSNESSRDIDVLPKRFSAEFVGTGQRSVPVTPSPTPVDGLAIRLRTANLLNTCNSYAVQQDSAGLDRCRERVRRQIQQEQQQVVDANERLRRTALVATTVSPGGNVVGYVYFGSRHGEINLELPIGDKVFRFPFFF
jgi:TonB family protein